MTETARPEDLLTRVSLFAALGRVELAKLAAYLDPVELAAGDEVFRQGDSGDSLFKAVRGLPQSIEPRRDLWPRIARQLDVEEGKRPGLQIGWSFALAAALGCVALGALLTVAVMKSSAPSPNLVTQVAAPAATTPRIERASLGGYAMLGPEYEQARANLMIGLAERLDRLPPLERQKVERNLNEIRRALGEINAALQLAPNDTLLRELLLNTYHDELTLLANVNHIADSIPSRTSS